VHDRAETLERGGKVSYRARGGRGKDPVGVRAEKKKTVDLVLERRDLAVFEKRKKVHCQRGKRGVVLGGRGSDTVAAEKPAVSVVTVGKGVTPLSIGGEKNLLIPTVRRKKDLTFFFFGFSDVEGKAYQGGGGFWNLKKRHHHNLLLLKRGFNVQHQRPEKKERPMDTHGLENRGLRKRQGDGWLSSAQARGERSSRRWATTGGERGVGN